MQQATSNKQEKGDGMKLDEVNVGLRLFGALANLEDKKGIFQYQQGRKGACSRGGRECYHCSM